MSSQHDLNDRSDNKLEDTGEDEAWITLDNTSAILCFMRHF